MSCHADKKEMKKGQHSIKLTFALAGNANVGKSVIFNQLTGSNQIIGNWPGKTVDRAEGTLHFQDYDIQIIDLPGIYSFSTFSMEELVSRDYIALEKPDVVINVLDASILERNLFFTIQLIEMGVPLVVCLNQVDEAKKKGIIIEKEKLQEALGVPVALTVATRGEGIYELVRTAVEVAKNKPKRKEIKYRADVEASIEKLARSIKTEQLELGYPSRWVAIKLLEGDTEISKLVALKSPKVFEQSKLLSQELSASCEEPCFSIIASERYALASMIASRSLHQEEAKRALSEKIDWLTTHKVLGYFTSAGIIAGLLIWTFMVGDFLAGLIEDGLDLILPLEPVLEGSLLEVALNGVWGGIAAGVVLIIPFVVPFYLMLAMIEDSGILTRIAFMMDSAMHKIGLHGKALIPMILGYGCNVPAIHSTRIMETRREKILAAFAISFIPCTAVTIVILGLVGSFIGIHWALALYAVNIAIIFLLGRIAVKVVPGKSTGLIMEMHSFKVPSIKVVAKQTWARTKSLIYIVFPIYIVSSALIQVLYAVGVLTPISEAMSPLTVGWLGLPVMAGVLLILGVIRKEFIIIGAVAILGTTELSLFFTPVQFLTLALVAMLYIPCIATIGILVKEFGWKPAGAITGANILAAILIGGIAFRLLTLFL